MARNPRALAPGLVPAITVGRGGGRWWPRRAQSGSVAGEATRGCGQCRLRPLGIRQQWISQRQRSRAPAASTWKSATRWPRSVRNCSWISWRSKSASAPSSRNFPELLLPASGAPGPRFTAPRALGPPRVGERGGGVTRLAERPRLTWGLAGLPRGTKIHHEPFLRLCAAL